LDGAVDDDALVVHHVRLVEVVHEEVVDTARDRFELPLQLARPALHASPGDARHVRRDAIAVEHEASLALHLEPGVGALGNRDLDARVVRGLQLEQVVDHPVVVVKAVLGGRLPGRASVVAGHAVDANPLEQRDEPLDESSAVPMMTFSFVIFSSSWMSPVTMSPPIAITSSGIGYGRLRLKDSIARMIWSWRRSMMPQSYSLTPPIWSRK